MHGYRPDEIATLVASGAGLIPTIINLSYGMPFGPFAADFWAPYRTEMLGLCVFGVLSLTVIGGIALEGIHFHEEKRSAQKIKKHILEKELRQLKDKRKERFIRNLERGEEDIYYH